MVLTVQAAEVAARTGDGEALGARMEMIERFLLDRVYSQRTRPSIHLTNQHTALIASAPTDARPALADVAMVWAEQTLHPANSRARLRRFARRRTTFAYP